MLSKCVSSHSVLARFRRQVTSASLRGSKVHVGGYPPSHALCSLDFPPQKGDQSASCTLILPENNRLCYYSSMQDLPSTEEKDQAKRNLLIVLVLAMLITFPTVPYLLYRYGINNPTQLNKEIVFEIKQGDGISEIAGDLRVAGLVDSPFLFKLYLKLNGLEKNVQAGVYVVPPKRSIVDLANIFQFGRNDVTIRYIEGWRVEQLSQVLSEELEGIDYGEFTKEAREYEGYLFPDTYFINKDASQKEVLDILKGTFQEKTRDLLSGKNLLDAGLSEKEAVILASIVEREALKEDDRRVIAGILIKRYREGMRLEADATTQYAVALAKHCLSLNISKFAEAECLRGLEAKQVQDIVWWPGKLTKNDLNYDSPYNTRNNEGLPPKPISSFGFSALESVINHETSPYYFYLTDADGVTHYAATLEEHNYNTNKYLAN